MSKPRPKSRIFTLPPAAGPLSAILASAPGSAMLMGEHAVLHGRPALVCALDKRVRVRLVPRADRRVRIRSALGGIETELGSIERVHPLEFVTEPIVRRQHEFREGFDLDIESDFSHRVGLGSSAAVTAAVCAALRARIEGAVDRASLLAEAVEIIRAVQGSGSGADAAASVWGGIVLYRASPVNARRIPGTHPIALVYSGYKTPTPEVIRIVEARRRRFPSLFNDIFRLMGLVVREAAAAIRNADWPRVGELMNLHQGLQDALGVSDETFSRIVQALRAQPHVLGAKISGSGLGDCAIALGHARTPIADFESIPVSIDPDGVSVTVEPS